MKRVYEKQNVTPTESTGDTPYRNTHGFCYTGSDKACVITKTRWTLSLKGKDHSANTREKSGGEARRDDPLWKDLLARAIDDKRDVVFLTRRNEAIPFFYQPISPVGVDVRQWCRAST